MVDCVFSFNFSSFARWHISASKRSFSTLFRWQYRFVSSFFLFDTVYIVCLASFSHIETGRVSQTTIACGVESSVCSMLLLFIWFRWVDNVVCFCCCLHLCFMWLWLWQCSTVCVGFTSAQIKYSVYNSNFSSVTMWQLFEIVNHVRAIFLLLIFFPFLGVFRRLSKSVFITVLLC